MGHSSIVTLLKKVSHHPFSSHHDASLREGWGFMSPTPLNDGKVRGQTSLVLVLTVAISSEGN